MSAGLALAVSLLGVVPVMAQGTVNPDANLGSLTD